MPGESEQYSVVFTKTLITGGKKFGIECNIVNNKMELNFQNMFSYSKTESRSFLLKSPDKLKTEDWTHILITIDPMTGKAILFEDGKEKAEIVAIKSEENPTSLPFGFHQNDTTPLLIGKGFFGKLDHFLIGIGIPKIENLTEPYHGIEYDDMTKFASQRKGVTYSPVLETKNSFSRLLSIDFDVVNPVGTQSEIFFRVSNTFFTENDSDLPWTSVSEFKKLQKEKAQLEENFKYLQWKMIMRSDYSGQLSPSLNKIEFSYSESLPPSSPIGLKVEQSEADPLAVCLSWISNHEENVKKGGKYYIHYGLSPERMVGTLTIKDKSGKNDITGLEEGKELTQNYKTLKQCVNNELIIDNAEANRKDKNLLLFKPGLTYYFKITAVNSNYNEKTGIGLDQKSQPSKAVLFGFKN